jgi:hypothetical protein
MAESKSQFFKIVIPTGLLHGSMSLTNRSIGKTCKEVNAMLVLYLLQTEAGFFPFF